MKLTRMHIVLDVLQKPLVPLIIGPLLLFGPLILSGRALFWGLPALQFNPWQAYTLELLKQGLLPLWNPLNGMGAPLLANYQLAFFYPPTWLAYLFGLAGGLPAMAWSQSLILAGHLVWAGIGTALFVRSLGLSSLAQTVAGLCFSMGSYLVGRSGFFSMVWAAAWLPWLMYLGGRFTAGQGWGDLKTLLWLTVCAAMLLLAGHAQLAWYSLLLTSFWILYTAWNQGRLAKVIRAGIGWATAIGGALGLGAVQLLPTLEYLQQSQRSAAVGFDSGLTFSFWPWRLLTFLAPDFFGNPGTGNYSGYGSYWEDAAYIGLAGLFFALSTLGLILSRQKQAPGEGRDGCRRVIWFFWIAASVGIIFALGKNTPVFLFLYEHVPTFNLFNGPARWMIWTVFSLCVLAGFGVEKFLATAHRKRRWRLASVACFAISLGAGAAWFMLKDLDAAFIQATATAGLGAFGLTVLAGQAPSALSGRQSGWAGWLTLFILADLLLAGAALLPAVPASFYDFQKQAEPIPAAIQPGSRIYIQSNDEYFLKFSRFFRFGSYLPLEPWENLYGAVLPNQNLLWEIPSANNFDPFVPRRYADWMKRLEEVDGPAAEKMWALMNVGGVESIDPGVPQGVRFDLKEPLPRFRFIGCDKSSLVNSTGGPDFAGQQVERDTVWIDLGGTSQLCQQTSAPGGVEIIQESPLRLKLKVSNPVEGYLFAADTFFPGWKAIVDGLEEEIRPADLTFRAVKLAPGAHQVEFVYDPASFRIGSILSGGGWITLLFIAFIINRRHRSQSTL